MPFSNLYSRMKSGGFAVVICIDFLKVFANPLTFCKNRSMPSLNPKPLCFSFNCILCAPFHTQNGT